VSTSGHIYLIKNKILGGYKIGRTGNLSQRLKQLEVPAKGTLVNSWFVPHVKVVERLLHKDFHHKRVPQSEWFALTAEDIEYVNEICTKVVQAEEKPKQEPTQARAAHTVQPLPTYQPRYVPVSVSSKPLYKQIPAWAWAVSCLIPPVFIVLAIVCLIEAVVRH